MMPRAAGSSHVYTAKGSKMQLDFPSVTHILGFNKDLYGAGGMAWWGFGLGARASLDIFDLDTTYEELYEDFKKGPWTPNKQRDEKADTGREAHDLLEAASNNEVIITRGSKSEDTYIIEGDPEFLAKIQQLSGRRKTSWLKSATPDMLVPKGKLLAAGKWWLENADSHNLMWAEQVVRSLKYGFAGQLDFARNIGDTDLAIPEVELVDYKSHKPSYGMRKDGSYPEGKGPAYFSDMAQTQAYAQAANEMGLFKATRFRTVLVCEDGEFYEDTREVSFDLFLAEKLKHDELCSKTECQAMARIYGGR
jgi:hypothetical protein